MTDGGVSTDRLLYVPEDIYPSISKYIINKADVFITVAGTIGRVGKIPDELDGANLTENADRLVLAVVNQDWLIKVLQSGMIQEQIAEATTQVGQPKLAVRYGIDPVVVYPHSFRHRFAKSFLERCNDIAFLADLMGHESIETTRIYLRKTSTEQRAIVDEVIDW